MKKSNKTPIILISTILVGSIGFGLYKDFKEKNTLQAKKNDSRNTYIQPIESTNNNILSSDQLAPINTNIESNPDSTQSHIVGQVLSINTNANKITFIKLREKGSSQTYTLSTYLKANQLKISIGDELSFSHDLTQSENGRYYLVHSTNDYKIISKNQAELESDQMILPLSEISRDMIGKKVSTSGTISNLYISSKGHVFFSINKDGKQVKSVLFSSENQQLAGRLDLLKKYSDSTVDIKFSGTVDIYKDELEIIVSKVYK